MARTALSWNRSPEARLLLSSFPPVRSRCHPSLGLRQRYNSSDLGAWQPTPSHGPLIRHTFLRVEPSHGLGPVPILTDDHEMDRKKQKLESHIRTLKGLPSMSSRFFRKWMSSLPRGRKPSYLRDSCVRRRTWANLFFFLCLQLFSPQASPERHILWWWRERGAASVQWWLYVKRNTCKQLSWEMLGAPQLDPSGGEYSCTGSRPNDYWSAGLLQLPTEQDLKQVDQEKTLGKERNTWMSYSHSKSHQSDFKQYLIFI